MDKQELLVLAKRDMKQLIDEITLDTISPSQDKLYKYFHYLEVLNKLPDVTTTMTLPDNIVETVAKAIEEDPAMKEQPEDTEPVKVAYRFERKIKGGVLPGLNAFVPETAVRELELENGDLVFATKLDESFQDPDGPVRYDFEIAEYRNEVQPKDRIEINYAVAEYSPMLGRFICEKTYDGTLIRLGEVPHTILLQEKDVRDLRLKNDDIIDLAYMKNQPEYVRITWRYSTDEQTQIINSEKSVSKKKSEKEKREYPQTLKGKSVLMVGFQPGEASMKEEVVRRGGELIWASGKEGYDRLETLIKKSDCLINMLQHVGHRGTTDAVEIAKEWNVPHGRIHNFGRTSFVQEVYRLLDIDSEE
jgi:hypothetical protein